LTGQVSVIAHLCINIGCPNESEMNLPSFIRVKNGAPGIKPRYICNLCGGQPTSLVWKHVLTARHRRLKEELELVKVIQAAVILGASKQMNMQINLGQFKVANTEVGQFDRHETGDYEMRTHSDGYLDSLDSMLDHDLNELGQAINLFIDSRESGSNLSSNGVAAAMIWEERD
jgi:hypothetical protein